MAMNAMMKADRIEEKKTDHIAAARIKFWRESAEACVAALVVWLLFH